MSKLYVAIASDRLENYRTAQGNDFISAAFTYGGAKEPKDAVKVELGADPFSASVWVNPELRPKDRGIRLIFAGKDDDLYEYLSAVIFFEKNSYCISETFQSADELTVEQAEVFSAKWRNFADRLNLHYDRTALDKWLEDDPR